jgi:hypothetical protein
VLNKETSRNADIPKDVGQTRPMFRTFLIHLADNHKARLRSAVCVLHFLLGTKVCVLLSNETAIADEIWSPREFVAAKRNPGERNG